MSSIDFNSVDSGQARLEAVAKAKESPQDLKQRLAQYRQTYINEVDGQQRTLNADANAFVAKDAQQYLKDAAKSLGNSVVNLAVEGENLQRRGIAAAAAPSGQVEPTEKPAALDFSTLAGLKKAVQSELAGQTGELAVWRQIEQIGGNFEKGWQNYQKSFAKAPSLEGLSANLAARQAQKTTLEGIRKQYEAIKPTAGSLRAWQEDSRDMAVFLTRIDLHLKEGEKVLETRAALTAQQAGLGTVEKTLRAAKTLTAEEFAQHLSSLQKQGQDLAGLQSIITQRAGATGEFTGLYPALLERYHQPLSDRLTQLHGLLEIKKPVPPASEQEKTDGEKAGEGKDANPIPAEQEHRFRLFIGGAQSTLSAIDKRVGTLEKELAAAAKKPDLWLNRTDYDAWLSRLDTELGASTYIKNELESWERQPDQAPAAKDFLNRYFQPAWRRAQSLRDRADRERGEAVKNNEKKILNQKVAEMHAELLREWQGKKESEQYLSISDKLSGLKPEDKEYQTLAAKQDALAKDLISFEGKVAFLLSKPDDLEKDVLTALQKIQADCRQWQNQIGGDRVLRQSRTAAAIEPDQPHPYTVERRTRAFVKAGPGGGGHWEDRVEKEEKTEHYKFGQYVQFVSIHDPKHAPAGGQEGRGWIWINGGEKLPDQVRQALSNRADLIVREQKDQVDAQSGRERREVRQQDLLTPKGREVLGADGARYFAGVDFLAKGDVQKAMAEFNAYLEVAKEFDAAKQELHAGCIEDANRHIESHRDFPEFLNALKLQAEGKIDEAVKQFRAFLARVNAKFGGAMGSELVGPEHPDRQKYAEQINVAIEVIKKFNNDKLKILDELSKDFIYLQTVDTASRIGKVSPLDFANLKGAQREMMLPYIPAGHLTPAERIRQSRQMGGLRGGEIGAIKDAIKNLREKIEKGDPPVDFESEFAAIKADLNKYTETTPGGSVWKDPNTNAVLANSPSSRLLVYFNQLNSSDPAVREKGFLAVAAEFKEREVGMRYTQKYLRQAMVSRYRAFAETEDGKSVATEVRKRLAADPATNREITVNARELYKRWAAEQKPPLPADPPDPIVMQSFKQNISDSIFEDQYEREMRRTMTSRGNAADDAARYLYINNSVPSSSLTPWKDLSRERKLTWLAQVADGDLGVALLDGGALKQYNWSRPYDEGDAKWYKPWSWKNYNEDDYNAFKAEAAEIAIQTVATLPIGFGAGAVGRVIGLGAVKLLVREGLTEAAVGALSRGGLRALMVAEKAGEKAIWSTLSSGMKARLLMHYGVGIAVEGMALAVMNSVWEGMYHGRADLFDSLDGGKYGKAGLFILENIAKAGLFRSIGAGQMGVSGLAGPNAKLLSRVLAESSGETVFGGFGGAGVEALFMLHDPKMREQLTWEWFAKSVLQNAAGSVAMRAGHSGMRLPEMGVFKGSREGTARRLTAAEIQLNGERLAARGIHTPADISNARIEANGDLVLRLKSGKDQIIKYSEIPFDRLPPEIRNHLYQTDKNNRDSLRAVLAETGLDSPLNWTGVTDDGAVVSTTGRIVPIADPALLPPALREKHRLLVEERRQARLGPYRRPGRVEPDQPTVIRAEAAPAAKPETPAVKTDTPANKATPGAEIAPDALRPAPETPPRLLPPGEASTRLTGVRNTLKLYEQRTKLSADPQKNATELARLDAQINAAAKAKNLSPEQYRRQLQTDEKLYRGLDALDRGERQLYGESKVIKKPVLDENGIQKKDANGQLIYQEVNLFANYESKSAAYSREMLRSLSYERLVAEGGGKIIKLGGDELVVYHAGPDGTVQKLFIDISNMGPTNDTATNIAGSKVNLVDIYLHRLSEAVLAQSKAHQGKLLDPGAFNAEVLRVADSLFNLDRDAGGKPLDATEAAKRFDRLKAEWGLEGNFQEYLTDIQSMRILAEYRADTRALDSSYKNHPERTFTEHISAEIQAISGLTIPQLQQLIAANSTEFRTAFEGRLPKSPKLKAMPIDKLLKQIKSLDPASSKPEDLMMLYAMLARMDTATLSAIPALKPFSDKLAASRTALVGDPPHPRVEEPRLMDAKVVSIDLPPDIAKALSALAETDPVRAHAILATARQFSEKSLDALKYGQRGRFAKFDITTYVEVKNGQLQVKPDAPDFLRAVETSRSDKKIGNVIDAEDSLRLARSKMETLQQQLADGKISHDVFLQQIMVVEVEIGILTTKLSIDPDTGAYGQAYLDVRPTTMYHFPDGVLPPENRVWHSVVTELGHSGVINAKYGYQAMDGIMAEYCQILRQGIAAELPPNLRHFKIIRSGGGKFEVAFLDSRAVAHLAAKGLTPHQLIERLANGPGQQAVDRVLQADPKKVAASQTDAAVRNSQFRYNKGTDVITVGRLTARTESTISQRVLANAHKQNPDGSMRSLMAKALEKKLSPTRKPSTEAPPDVPTPLFVSESGLDLSMLNLETVSQILQKKDFSMRELLDALKTTPELAALFEASAGVRDKITIETHVERVAGQFEKYLAGVELPPGVDKNFFRMLIALHDIGKPKAIARGDKSTQHEDTIPIMRDVLRKLQYKEPQIELMLALMDGDPLGEAIQKKKTPKQAAYEIEQMAKRANMPVQQFYQLLDIFYKADASSYTSDAGGMPLLDKKFSFDPGNRKIGYSPESQKIIDQIRAEMEQLKQARARGMYSQEELSIYARENQQKLEADALKYSAMDKVERSAALEALFVQDKLRAINLVESINKVLGDSVPGTERESHLDNIEKYRKREPEIQATLSRIEKYRAITDKDAQYSMMTMLYNENPALFMASMERLTYDLDINVSREHRDAKIAEIMRGYSDPEAIEVLNRLQRRVEEEIIPGMLDTHGTDLNAIFGMILEGGIDTPHQRRRAGRETKSPGGDDIKLAGSLSVFSYLGSFWEVQGKDVLISFDHQYVNSKGPHESFYTSEDYVIKPTSDLDINKDNVRMSYDEKLRDVMKRQDMKRYLAYKVADYLFQQARDKGVPIERIPRMDLVNGFISYLRANSDIQSLPSSKHGGRPEGHLKFEIPLTAMSIQVPKEKVKTMLADIRKRKAVFDKQLNGADAGQLDSYKLREYRMLEALEKRFQRALSINPDMTMKGLLELHIKETTKEMESRLATDPKDAEAAKVLERLRQFRPEQITEYEKGGLNSNRDYKRKEYIEKVLGIKLSDQVAIEQYGKVDVVENEGTGYVYTADPEFIGPFADYLVSQGTDRNHIKISGKSLEIFPLGDKKLGQLTREYLAVYIRDAARRKSAQPQKPKETMAINPRQIPDIIKVLEAAKLAKPVVNEIKAQITRRGSEALPEMQAKHHLTAETMRALEGVLGVPKVETSSTRLAAGPTEDTPRIPIELRAIKEFPQLPADTTKTLTSELTAVIGETHYNSMIKLDTLIEHYERGKAQNPDYTLLDAYREMGPIDSMEVNSRGRGNNCIGMSYGLQRRLAQRGVLSYMVRFSAGGLVNAEANNYVGVGHGALIVPSTEMGQKYYTLVDAGLLISQPIKFPVEGNSAEIFIGNKKYQVLKNPPGAPYPFILSITTIDITTRQPLPKVNKVTKQPLLDKNGKPIPDTVNINFDPTSEWVNPDATIQTDIMRGLGDVKITRQTPEGRNMALFRVDLQKDAITIKLGDKQFLGDKKVKTEAGKIDQVVSFESFLNMANDPDLQKAFNLMAEYLGENPAELYTRTKKLIELSPQYRAQIWTPSVREGLAREEKK